MVRHEMLLREAVINTATVGSNRSTTDTKKIRTLSIVLIKIFLQYLSTVSNFERQRSFIDY